jgi:hypothetical protein
MSLFDNEMKPHVLTDMQADNQIENLVPILMLNYNIDCSSAVERSSLLVQEAACAFHEVEKRLRGLSQQSPNPVTEMFLQGCKDVVMGLTYWRYFPSCIPLARLVWPDFFARSFLS